MDVTEYIAITYDNTQQALSQYHWQGLLHRRKGVYTLSESGYRRMEYLRDVTGQTPNMQRHTLFQIPLRYRDITLLHRGTHPDITDKKSCFVTPYRISDIPVYYRDIHRDIRGSPVGTYGDILALNQYVPVTLRCLGERYYGQSQRASYVWVKLLIHLRQVICYTKSQRVHDLVNRQLNVLDGSHYLTIKIHLSS